MAAPQTTYEATGAWTSIADGNTFLSTVASETEARLETIGVSYNGIDMYAITIGQGASTLLVVGSVHGNEPAPREMLLIKARDLAYSTDPDILGYLSSHTVSFIPTGNPDGLILGTRNNAQDKDINRDAYSLDTPERKNIERFIRQNQPHIVLDCHERQGTPDKDIDVLSRMKLDLNSDPIVEAKGIELQTYVTATLETQALTVGEYPTDYASQTGILAVAGLMGSIEFLQETYAEDTNKATRVNSHCKSFDAVRQWHEDNSGYLSEHLFKAYAVNTPHILYTNSNYYLDAVQVKVDMPDGYVLGESVDLSKWIDVYNIKVIDGIVPTFQPAVKILPGLLDSESSNAAVSATRFYNKKYGKIDNIWVPVKKEHGNRNGSWTEALRARRF